jgi:hypothetical protein
MARIIVSESIGSRIKSDTEICEEPLMTVCPPAIEVESLLLFFEIEKLLLLLDIGILLLLFGVEELLLLIGDGKPKLPPLFILSNAVE